MTDSTKPTDDERQDPIVTHQYLRVDQPDSTSETDEPPVQVAPQTEGMTETDIKAAIADAAADIETETEPDPNQTELHLEAQESHKPKASVAPPKTPPRSKRKKAGGFKKLCFFLLILTTLLALVIGGLFAYFAQTNQYPIKTVKVIGEYQYVKESDIINVLKPYIVGKGLFAFSEWQAETALEQIPGVADASIWRVPPDKIKVIIRERAAVARFTNGALLSSKGVVFTTSNTEGAADLPLLSGNAIYGKDMLTMLESLAPIFATIDAKVTGLGLSENGDWSVQLNNQTWIMLGKKDLTDRVQDFLTAYPALMKTAESGASLSYVDLRYSHGFAASWTGGSASSNS